MKESDQKSIGGRTTNSPPVKVKEVNDEVEILSSGIDSLDLSINVEWENTSFFELLEKKKNKAKNEGNPVAISLVAEQYLDELECYIYPYGVGGHEWLLVGAEYTFQIDKRLKPENRPNVLVSIRSECLWTLNPSAAVGRIIYIMGAYGATNMTIKPSRVDLCVDALIPERLWVYENISSHRVTKAKKISAISDNDILETIKIGKGNILARLYDKVREIKYKSKKFWMFDIWKIKSVPEGKRVIRVEFQIRREVLKEMNINTSYELLLMAPNLWAYCTQDWLKFQSNPGKHHTQRNTLDWWEAIQNGYNENQKATPSIRAKAINIVKRQLFMQAYGLICAFEAADQEEIGLSAKESEFGILETLYKFKEMANDEKMGNEYFRDAVLNKRVKYSRDKNKLSEANLLRKKLGFPLEAR